jgi:hypothetical protein
VCNGELGVKQVLRAVPDVLPNRREANIPLREVTDAELTGDHDTSRSESDNESFHD